MNCLNCGCSSCQQAAAVTLMTQTAPSCLTCNTVNPYYINRGDNFRIVWRNASVNNQTVRVADPVMRMI